MSSPTIHIYTLTLCESFGKTKQYVPSPVRLNHHTPPHSTSEYIGLLFMSMGSITLPRMLDVAQDSSILSSFRESMHCSWHTAGKVHEVCSSFGRWTGKRNHAPLSELYDTTSTFSNLRRMTTKKLMLYDAGVKRCCVFRGRKRVYRFGGET